MAETNFPGQKVLVVEDYDDNRLMLKTLLERRGYSVLEAVNGEEAVEMAQREHPDLILMDINLPLLDGFVATQYIRQQEDLRDTPIVALTAYGNSQSREVALAAGCNDYLEKPVNFAQVERLLKHYLPGVNSPLT
ncbi:MAG TPA: response regulator [Pyrinomonadaceae bacterium]|nr:response regulator [Pyrinomonadaceae bacterium]